jgi:hypothetical protein
MRTVFISTEKHPENNHGLEMAMKRHPELEPQRQMPLGDGLAGCADEGILAMPAYLKCGNASGRWRS